MQSIPLFQVCAWPDCVRTNIFSRGLCRRCHMRARRAGALEAYVAPPKVCQWCLHYYSDGTSSGKTFCSSRCQQAAFKQRNALRRTRRVMGRTCVVCAQPIPISVQDGAKHCSVVCQQAAWYTANVDLCKARAIEWNRTHYEVKRATNMAWYARNPVRTRELSQAWCAANRDLVRLLARQRAHNRRARKYGVGYEKVTLAELWERDNGICWLCEEPVDPALRHPDPMSVSMDHIVPLVKGGVHAAHNVAIAHLVCNLRKGVKLVVKD